jgi:type VI secretion system protein ImpE
VAGWPAGCGRPPKPVSVRAGAAERKRRWPTALLLPEVVRTVTGAKQLFAAGRLKEAIDSAGSELSDSPSDAPLRTFLFELLCFAGNWDRAEKQLELLSGGDRAHRLGALLYLAAIQAERTRQDMFSKGDLEPPSETEPAPVSGSCNGVEFSSFQDSDPRLGPRLEVFAGGSYLWIPFHQIVSLEMRPPARLRDLLWAPASIQTASGFQGGRLGEVLLPVLYPFSWRHPEDDVKLGRKTAWEESQDRELASGQKMFLVDGEEIPILEVRRVEMRPSA